MYVLPGIMDLYQNMFADDAKVIREVKNKVWVSLQQRGLDKQKFGYTWSMKFSLSRCKIMKMGCYERRPRYDYYLEGNKLQESVCETDLGINIVLNQFSTSGELLRRQSLS